MAQERGLCLLRTASLNTSPTFIEALAQVVEAHLSAHSCTQIVR
jgi:hypothetical protein